MAQYIKYGDLEIDYNELIRRADEGLLNYLNNQSWTSKRKKFFLDAYNNIKNLGIREIYNDGIIANGNIDLNSLSRKEKEMYGALSRYYTDIAKQLPTKTFIEEEAEKKRKASLLKFGDFLSNFVNYIGKKYFGGNDIRIGSGENDDWNYLDERDSNGIRGTKKRAERLAEYLENYSKSLGDNYDFEDSAFIDLNDLKNRINVAISKLKDGTWNQDDKDALNSIGLRSSDWFNNGSGDLTYDDLGNQLTYAELARLNQILAKLKAEAEAKKALEEVKKKALQQKVIGQNAIIMLNKLNPKSLGRSALELKEKYLTGDNLMQALNNYAQRGFKNLNNDEKADLIGAYKYLANEPIDSHTYSILQSSPAYKNSIFPNRFKKIKGIDNIVKDSSTGLIIQLYNTQQWLAYTLPDDLFAGIKTQLELENEYLNNPRGGNVELTAADYRDIGATLADLTALVNPEIVTGTLASLGAAGARTWNRVAEKGLWDGMLNWENAMDWGTAILGGTPLWGDATSFAKFARGFGKLMTLPAVINAFYNVPEAKQALSKIDKNNLIESLKTLTPADYKAIASVLTGVVGGRNYLKGNLAERQVIQHSGYTPEQIKASKGRIRQWGEKTGLLRTKVPGGELKTNEDFLKVEINGKLDKIKIDSDTKAKIKEASTKAGKNAEKRNSEVEKVLKDKNLIKENDKIKVEEPNWRDWGTKYLRLPSMAGTTNRMFTTNSSTSQINRGEGDFENWLNNRSFWNKWKYGTNENMRDIQSTLGINNARSSIGPQESEIKSGNLPQPPQLEPLFNIKRPIKEPKPNYKKVDVSEVDKSFEELRNFKKSYGLDGSSSSMVGGYGKSNLESGSLTYTFGGKTFTFKVSRKTLKNINEGKISTIRGKMARQVSNLENSKKADINDIAKVLRDLKRKGWLKHGGRLDRLKIQKYKTYIRK